jgi:hypothetical protein
MLFGRCTGGGIRLCGPGRFSAGTRLSGVKDRGALGDLKVTLGTGTWAWQRALRVIKVQCKTRTEKPASKLAARVRLALEMLAVFS